MARKEFGKHYIVEFIGCEAALLERVASVKKMLLTAARLSEATVLKAQFHQFKPVGVTGMLFIAESHFSIHTWPEDGYAAFDVLTCGKMFPQKAIAYLRTALKAKTVKTRIVSRGF